MPAVGRAVDAATMVDALRRTAANHPEVVALRTVDDAQSLTWAEVLERVEAIGAGLAGLGVRRGDAVAIVPGDWLPGGEELTPTMKLKRKPIAARYAAEIEAMYSV